MKISKFVGVAWLAGLSAFGSFSTPAYAQASEPFLGQLMLFGGNFCPRNWANADGQILPIASNQALFSLFGTLYGGDGRITFALPDLRGRAPISPGAGPGLTTFNHGQKTGSETQQILVQNMPPHRHNINVTNTIADKPGPGGKRLAAMGNSQFSGPYVYSTAAANKTLSDDSISYTGSGVPIPLRAPELAIQWCVALTGVYPARN